MDEKTTLIVTAVPDPSEMATFVLGVVCLATPGIVVALNLSRPRVEAVTRWQVLFLEMLVALLPFERVARSGMAPWVPAWGHWALTAAYLIASDSYIAAAR